MLITTSQDETMKLNQALIAGILTLLFCLSTQAAVYQLNNQSVAQCRKQLSSVAQKYIVVAAYEPECHWWDSYQPIYTSVANSMNFPAAFFRYDFENAAPGVTAGCLSAEVPGCPTTLMYNKNKHRYGLVRMKTGYQSQQELSSFIMGQ